MYTLKQAHLARDKTGGKVYEFYIDMRTAGKGYEEFYKRIQEEGVYFIRGKGAEKDIPDTVAQASAAASRALVLLSQGEVQIEPVTAEVITERCSGCGECVMSCVYSAIALEDGKAVVNSALCKGCGTCAGACLAKAIVLHHFTDEELVAELEGIFSEMLVYERVVA